MSLDATEPDVAYILPDCIYTEALVVAVAVVPCVACPRMNDFPVPEASLTFSSVNTAFAGTDLAIV